MHPGQYTVLNSIHKDVVRRSVLELLYHVEVLDLMELKNDAKVQIHVGGVYGNKKESMQRFIDNYRSLEPKIKKRLVIENDDKSYSLKYCVKISKDINIPIIFDVYHHLCKNSGESIENAFNAFYKTWKTKDGVPIVHYSSEHPIKGKPSHAEMIDIIDFKHFLDITKNYDFDVMLEIKNKEKSALKALKIIMKDPRFSIVN
jgi:UV DNA damage endonuclease